MSRRARLPLLRWAIMGMVLVGIVGISRVLLGASDTSEAWMRWAPSAALADLSEGRFVVLEGSRPAMLSALTRAQLDVLAARTATIVPQRDPLAADLLEDRVLRVELEGRTRWFAVHAAEPRPGCRIERSGDGWSNPCNAARYDLAGRALDAASADLGVAPVLIRRGTLYLRPPTD